MVKIIDQNWDCLYKKNPAYYILNDTLNLFTLAEEAHKASEIEKEEMFSRTSILMFPIALEAFINIIYEYYEVYDKHELKKISVKNKWLNASRKCLPNVGTLIKDNKVLYKQGMEIDTFDENSPLFLKYLELKEIRNDIVHLKPDFIHIKFENIEKYEASHKIYPLTKIPKEISSWKFKHATIAKSIFDTMIFQLNKFMKGELDYLLKSPAFIEKIISQ